MGLHRRERPPRPTDEEVRAIAERIARAVRSRPADDPRDDICSVIHELYPEDEDRVIATLDARVARG